MSAYLTRKELMEIVKDLTKFEQILISVENNLNNHLASHGRKEIALILIMGSLAVSVFVLVIILYTGG